MQWGVRLLGRIALSRDGQDLPLAGEKQRLVVAAVALSPGVAVPTQRIVDLVWGDAAPRTARRTVQSHIAAIRSLMGPEGPLEAGGSGYVLSVERAAVDLLAFEDAVSTALGRAPHDPASTARSLAELLAGWDEPLAGTRCSDRMMSVLAPFEELHLQATEALLIAQIDSGNAEVAVRALEALVRRQPTREHLWLQLSRALDASGRRRDAIRAVQRAREALREELGIEPGAALRVQEHRLLDGGAVPDGATSAASPKGASGTDLRRHPPPTRSPMIGRATELEDLRSEIGRSSFITLTGTGGIGKTTLALELARRVADDFEDGVAFVDLATASTREAVHAAVAAGVGAVQAHLDPLEAVTDLLGSKQVLLLLDNCEHVLPAVFDIIESLAICQRVRILATSREPVGAEGESVWRVSPLEPRAAGVELFCLRVRATHSSFSPTEPELEAIVSICERLDGIPLAIELAAGYAGSMSVLDLADRLDDRFRLLRRRRSGTERHQTLLATVDWSYQLLDESSQRLFATLSVFAGGFDLVAAEHIGRIAAADIDVDITLTDLVNKSMVEFDPRAGRGRYRILETLREFGTHQLDALPERELVHDCHMRYYADVAEDAHAHFTGEDWDRGKALVTLEWVNLRVAIDRALTTRRVDMAERIIAATYRVSSILVRHEHAQWTTAVLDLVDALGSPLDPLMAGAGAWWLHAQGRIAESQALALAGLAAAPSPIDASTERCWFALCLPERDPDELARMVTHWDAASAASSDPFARYTFAWCLAISSTRSWAQHDDRCQPWIEQSIALLEAAVTTTNNPAPRIWLAHARGIAARESGDVRQALDNYGRVVELSRVAEHHAMEAMAALFIAGALRAIEVIDPVAYSEAIEITHRHRVYCELTIGYLATHLLRRGHRCAGATLHGYVNASGSRVPPAVTWPTLGDDPDLAAWSQAGAAMTLDEAVECARTALADLTPPVDRPHMDTTG